MAARTLRLVAAAVLAAVTGLGAVVAAPGPAHAATCATGSGVTVVVDFKQLGGGVQSFCSTDGAGRSAAAVVGAAFDLTYVQRQPGFLCRVDGLPADDPCVNTPPATAYWGLFHSDGSSGAWTFSSLGIGSLQVDDGGSIGLAWQQGGSRTTPGVAAPVHASEPTPTPKPTAKPSPKPAPSKPTQQPTATPTAPGSSPSRTDTGESASAAPSGTPSADDSGGDGRGRTDDDRNGDDGGRENGDDGEDAGAPDESASPSPAADATPGEDADLDPVAAEASGARLPTLVTVLALAALLLGAVIASRRRRRAD